MGLGFSAVGIFGKLPFLCSSAVTFTFKDLSVSRSVRWATHEVIGKKPLLEYIGPGLTEVSFNIQLNSMLGTPPLAALIQLKKMLEKKQARVSGFLCLGRLFQGKPNEAALCI